MAPPQHPDDSPCPAEEICEDAFASALYDLLELLDRRDDTAHTEIIRLRLERLAADGCSQLVIDLYHVLAQRVSNLVLDRYAHGLLKELEDLDKAALAKINAQLNRGPGRPELSEQEFRARRTTALRQLGARPGYKISKVELAKKMGMDRKTLRDYEGKYPPELDV